MFYLASRYSRLNELVGYKTQLETLGYQITSRWLLGGHGVDDDDNNISLQAQFAQDDLDDIAAAKGIISFTEPQRAEKWRGGRLIETGYALGLGKKVIVVGHRENLFCYLPEILFFKTWSACHFYLSSKNAQNALK